MSTTKLEHILLRSGSDDMNYPRGIFFLVQTLENHVVSSLFFIFNQLVFWISSFYHQWICLLANFALKCLPKEWTEVRRNFWLTFDLQPRLQTNEMDWPYWTCTSTTFQKRIFRCGESLPTKTTFIIVFIIVLICTHYCVFNFFELFKQLIIWLIKNAVGTMTTLQLWHLFIDIHVSCIWYISNFFYCKLDPTYF